jgi:hypothetical protein
MIALRLGPLLNRPRPRLTPHEPAHRAWGFAAYTVIRLKWAVLAETERASDGSN